MEIKLSGDTLAGDGPGVMAADALERATLALLAEVSVKSMTFKKGLTLDELITFLHALSRKFWDVKEGKEINERLRSERVFQVSVDEVQYVAVGEGDIVIEDDFNTGVPNYKDFLYSVASQAGVSNRAGCGVDAIMPRAPPRAVGSQRPYAAPRVRVPVG